MATYRKRLNPIMCKPYIEESDDKVAAIMRCGDDSAVCGNILRAQHCRILRAYTRRADRFSVERFDSTLAARSVPGRNGRATARGARLCLRRSCDARHSRRPTGRELDHD